MTEITPKPLRIDSWPSLNGTTFAVVDGHCLLSMHKSEEEAQAALEAVERANAEREKKWAGSTEETGVSSSATNDLLAHD